MIFGCAMQTFELAYELSKCGSLGCKYLIASEELIYWSGYNYKESFLCLLKNPDMSAKELGKQIIIDTKEKPDRNLKIEDEGHENKNKDDWAISCVNIKKCAELAKRLDKIAMKIFDLYDYTIDSYTPGNKKIKKDKALKFNDTLRKARAYCHYFGENAFPQSYIDTTWFLKMLNELIQSSYLSNDKIHLISYPSYRKLKYLKSELKKVISFLEIENENHLILKKWVGSKLSSDKKIRIFYFSGDEVYDQVNSSPGAHGIGIYFPISGEENEKDSGNKLFFESHSDYDLEFVKIKKNGWRHMLKDYWTKNVELTTEVITKDKLQSNEEIP